MTACSLCTFINGPSRKTCEICDNILPQKQSSVEVFEVISDDDSCDVENNDEDDDDSEKDAHNENNDDIIEEKLFAYMSTHLYDFHKERSPSSDNYVCKYDSKTFRSSHMLKAHLYKDHKLQLMDIAMPDYSSTILKKRALKKSVEERAIPKLVSAPSSSSSSSSMHQVAITADEQFALELAMREFESLGYHYEDFIQNKRQRRSTSTPRVKHPTVSQSVTRMSVSRGSSSGSSGNASQIESSGANSELPQPTPSATLPSSSTALPSSLSKSSLSDRSRTKHGLFTAFNNKETAQNDRRIDRGAELGNEENRIDYEQRQKNSRLQKLLDKTDKIVRDIRRSIDSSTTRPVDSEGDAEVSGFAERKETISAPKMLTGGTLRDYQLGGLQWLYGLHHSGVNGIFADEMGLGKTLQVLAFFGALLESDNVWGPHLVVMPLSVVSSWTSDITKFCPSIQVHIHHGDRDARTETFNAWRRDLQVKLKERVPKQVHVCITTYQIAIADEDLLRKVGKSKSHSHPQSQLAWSYLVVDEGQRLKNHAAVLFASLSQLGARRRLLLTGTPLQNNLGELWSLLHFILPGTFNDFQQFSDWFNRPFEYDDEGAGKKRHRRDRTLASSAAEDELNDEEKRLVVASLHRALKPFLLRRVKADVALDVPRKIERLVHCPWSPLQKRIYRRLMELKASSRTAESSWFTTADSSSLKKDTSVSNLVMQLRKLCNHPYLILEDVVSVPDALYFGCLVSACGKLCVLERLLKILIPNGHKILIFSQMTTTLNVVEGFLSEQGYQCCRLDGTSSNEARSSALASFSSGPDAIPVFLLSTRAGGVGVNLQAADTVIFYDSDWNPQQDAQAMARAHRIGQTRTVLVLRLVTEGIDADHPSVEQELLSTAGKKLQAEREVLANRAFDMGTSTAALPEEEEECLAAFNMEDFSFGRGEALLDVAALEALCRRDNTPTTPTTLIEKMSAGCLDSCARLITDEECVLRFQDWLGSSTV